MRTVFVAVTFALVAAVCGTSLIVAEPPRPASDRPPGALAVERRIDEGVPAQLQNADFSAPLGEAAPIGWTLDSTAYVLSLDAQVIHGAKPSLKIVAKPDEKIALMPSLHQAVSATAYRGKRVRFSGWMKTENAERCGLWINAANTEEGILTSDSDVPFVGRQQSDTTDWRIHELVVDVDEAATRVRVGIHLPLSGTAWVSELTLEVVSPHVPLTSSSSLRRKPTNLDFEANARLNGQPGDWACEGAPNAPPIDCAVDSETRRAGTQSARLRIAAGESGGKGAIVQELVATPYRGKTLVLAVYLKSSGLQGAAGPFIEATSQGVAIGEPLRTLASEAADTAARGITGTTDWKRIEVRLTVPADANRLRLGVRLHGPGTVWLDDAEFR